MILKVIFQKFGFLQLCDLISIVLIQIQYFVMFHINKHSTSQNLQRQQTLVKDYVRTTEEQKLQIIDLVINEKYSMKLSSKIAGVKLSTVKYIVKAYKTDKQEFMGKFKPKKDKLPKQKKSQRLESESPKIPVPLSEGNEQQKNVKIEQNSPGQNFECNQQKIVVQFQNNFMFQMISNPNQMWGMYLGWNNNWFFGSYTN